MSHGVVRPVTVVSFHAHPDDEALLTGGTLSKLSAAGHRVVLVLATSGEAGLAATAYGGDGRLGEVRVHEVHASARALGVARVVLLEYADSGYPEPRPRHVDASARCFADVDAETAAERLATVLREERAEVLTTYDRNGGYGHLDHVQVHRVGARAARIAGTPLVLEATIDRTLLTRLDRLLRLISAVFSCPRLPGGRALYTARSELTHRVDIRDRWREKRAAMEAHVSQATAEDEARTLAVLLRLPSPVFRRVFRYEWFREVGRTPAGMLLDDVLLSLHDRDPSLRA